MAAPNTTWSGVGAREARVFGLNASGYPNATATTVYEGLLLSGLKQLNLTDPEPRQIPHTGDDGVFALDSLPPNEAITGEFMTGKTDLAVEALLTSQLVITQGEKKGFGFGTDKRGFEAQVALTFFRQNLDTTPAAAQLRRWEFKIFPVVIAVPIEGGFNENTEEKRYVLRPQVTGKHLWGTAFAVGTEGFTRAQGVKWITQYKPKVVAFLGDNSATVFAFPAAYQAAAAGKIDVWKNGVEVTAGITKATTGITFTVAPALNDLVVVFYEYA